MEFPFFTLNYLVKRDNVFITYPIFIRSSFIHHQRGGRRGVGPLFFQLFLAIIPEKKWRSDASGFSPFVWLQYKAMQRPM